MYIGHGRNLLWPIYIDWGWSNLAVANILVMYIGHGLNLLVMNNVIWPWPNILIRDFFFGHGQYSLLRDVSFFKCQLFVLCFYSFLIWPIILALHCALYSSHATKVHPQISLGNKSPRLLQGFSFLASAHLHHCRNI